MRVIVFMCSLLISTASFSQVTFQKSFGGPKWENNECLNRSTGIICNVNNGGFAVCHSSASFGNTNSQAVYFLKLDQNGDTVFARSFYSNSSHLFGRSVNQTQDGGFVLGYSVSGSSSGLAKTDINGNLLWSKSFGGNVGYHSLLLDDGSFLSTGGAGGHIHLFKLDGNGDVVFGKRYTSNVRLTLYSSYECSNGDIVSVGVYDDMGVGNILLIRTNPIGNVIFSKHYKSSASLNIATQVVELSDNSLVIVGGTKWVGYYDIFLFKVDAIGTPIFHKIIGDSSTSQWSNSIIADNNDNIYIAGTSTNSVSAIDAILIKTNSDGNPLWSKRYENGEYGVSLTLAPDGGVAIAGMTKKFGAGDFDVFVIKTDLNGDAGCNVSNLILPIADFPLPTTDFVLNTTIDSASSNYPLLVGYGTSISTKCSNVGIKDKTMELGSSVYPNPTSGRLKFDQYEDINQVRIVDVAGREVLLINNPLGEINVSGLIDGIYTAIISTSDERFTERFIKK